MMINDSFLLLFPTKKIRIHVSSLRLLKIADR